MNLTLIDLPGLTKVAVGKWLSIVSYCSFLCSCLRGSFSNLLPASRFIEGQSDSVVQDIENMVRSFIEKVFCCNLFVCCTLLPPLINVKRIIFEALLINAECACKFNMFSHHARIYCLVHYSLPSTQSILSHLTKTITRWYLGNFFS